jgi:hypothetical protein
MDVALETALGEQVWQRRARQHRERVRRWTGPHRDRRRSGTTHPVMDFLFSYYSHPPGRLERWHPGPGVRLLGPAADGYLGIPGYRRVRRDGQAGVRLDPRALPARRVETAAFVLALLTASAGRAPRLNCFGMHEWAMVYRTGQPRHPGVPLRLGADRTDTVVESMPLRCTHHDAFRFFSAEARPRNETAPARADQLGIEQPGCLHATMDLYKWAYKLHPATPSELVADCFALAVEVRELDMRASPYDLTALGYSPVPVETAAGRAYYARAQAAFASRAAPLRDRLIDLCRTLTTDG